jgi:hypothetical protein
MWIKLGSCALVAAAVLAGADIHGTIVIDRKLSRRNVTASAGMYQRGVAVELAADGEEDALAFERSPVAVYLESGPKSPATDFPKASIEQKDRRFVADLVVIPAGATVLSRISIRFSTRYPSLPIDRHSGLGAGREPQITAIQANSVGVGG